MRNYALFEAQQLGFLPSAGILTRVWNNWKSRRAIVRLAAFDDHMLRDIGVTRAHIEVARNTPLTENTALRFKNVVSAGAGCVASKIKDRGLLDPRYMSDHFKRDIGWLDGQIPPGSSR
jgi:uncharacterized protein YjiS (DUF1127 family)